LSALRSWRPRERLPHMGVLVSAFRSWQARIEAAGGYVRPGSGDEASRALDHAHARRLRARTPTAPAAPPIPHPPVHLPRPNRCRPRCVHPPRSTPTASRARLHRGRPRSLARRRTSRPRASTRRTGAGGRAPACASRARSAT
jgi:hypothetical protein